MSRLWGHITRRCRVRTPSVLVVSIHTVISHIQKPIISPQEEIAEENRMAIFGLWLRHIHTLCTRNRNPSYLVLRLHLYLGVWEVFRSSVNKWGSAKVHPRFVGGAI